MMRILATLKIAARALRRNKLRTLLTMLGMIIGVGAVIAMVGIGNGAKSQIEAQIASMGQNVLLVFSGSFTRGGTRSGWGGAGTLTIEDAEGILREIPGVVAVSPEIRTRAQIAAGNQNWNTSIQGESPEYFDIRQWPIVAGSAFSPQDVRSANKVAVIGKTISDQLFPGEDPIGQIIRVKNVPFIVLGMLTPKGLSVQGPGKDDDFTVRNQQEIAEMATAQSKTMTLLLAAIAMVSLVVGGIGIMNIMLVSVTERTREIGIRMAIGARGRDILLQFLIEAVTLSVIGGILGIGSGFGVSKLIAAKTSWPTLVPSEWVICAFFVSAAVGIFFGFYPARKASQLDPIDALRYE